VSFSVIMNTIGTMCSTQSSCQCMGILRFYRASSGPMDTCSYFSFLSLDEIADQSEQGSVMVSILDIDGFVFTIVVKHHIEEVTFLNLSLSLILIVVHISMT
jgi:hypothetical protein